MAISNDKFIPARDFISLIDLPNTAIEQLKELQFYIHHTGWVASEFAGIEASNVHINGYFPSKLLKVTEAVHVDPFEHFEYVERYYYFEASFSSKHGEAGITDFVAKKLATLLFDEGDPIKQVYENYYFTHKEAEIDSSVTNLFVLIEDASNFCQDHGIFDFQSRYDLYLRQKGETEIPVPSGLQAACTGSLEQSNQENTGHLFHSNTSKALLDLVEANNKFWADYDSNNPNTAPKKILVTGWLREKGYNNTLAGYMDTVLREGRNQKGGFS